GSPRQGAGDREPDVPPRRQPGGRAPRRLPLRWTFDDRRSLGSGARAGPRSGGTHHRRPRPGAPARDPRAAARARQPATRRLWLARGDARLSADRSQIARAKAAPDKRRLILDAAVRVFAGRGFHACRVSDIAEEAGVAYGLVYHYFQSKDEVLDTLFL